MAYSLEQDGVSVRLEDDGGVGGGYGSNRQWWKIVAALNWHTQTTKVGHYYYLSGSGRDPERTLYNNVSLESLTVTKNAAQTLVDVLCRTQAKGAPTRTFNFVFDE